MIFRKPLISIEILMPSSYILSLISGSTGFNLNVFRKPSAENSMAANEPTLSPSFVTLIFPSLTESRTELFL